jgi:hypothetical protein
MYITEKIERYLNMVNESFALVRLGGSMGDGGSLSDIRQLKGKECLPEKYTMFDNKEKCKEAAKRFNGRLTPGEKQYYGIKYVPAEVINGKFTGK